MEDTPQYTRRRKPTRFIVVHAAYTTPDQDVDIDEVRRWHTEERGWIDVGYHLYIRRDGTTQIGRPLWAMGAHVAGYNDESVGICLEGGARLEPGNRSDDNPDNDDAQLIPEENFTAQQYGALAAIVSALVMKYPEARVQGHRDFPGVSKACPCFDVIPWWDSVMNDEVRELYNPR